MQGKSTRKLHVCVRAVHGLVDGRCAAAYGPCRRPCTRPVNSSSPAKTAHTWLYNGPAVYTARVYGCVLAVYTAVYMARTRPCNGGVHVCVCTRLCTRPRTGRVGPCRRLCTCRVQGRGPCTRLVRSVLLRFSLQKTPFMPKRTATNPLHSKTARTK